MNSTVSRKFRNNLLMKFAVMLVFGAIYLGACLQPAEEPPQIPSTASNLPDRLVDGPLPGCLDALELVEQSLNVPQTTIVFDTGGIIDRVNVVAAGVTYSFSTRPVNPDCSSTDLPSVPLPAINFGFNYLGDFSRVNPLCMNASTITLSNFSITGTPIDSAIEPVARESIWLEVDRLVATSLHPIINGGSFPSSANPRCSNWVDLIVLP